MPKATRVVAVMLGVAIAGTVGVGVAVNRVWPLRAASGVRRGRGPHGGRSIVLDASLDLAGAGGALPAVSMPIPAEYAAAVTTTDRRASTCPTPPGRRPCVSHRRPGC